MELTLLPIVGSNMNKIIFVLMQCDVGYESSSSMPICSSFDKKKMEDLADEMLIRRGERNKAKELQRINMAAYDAANPRPPYTNYRESVLPSFPGKQNAWTAEQKGIYTKARIKGEQERHAAGKILRDWSQKRYDNDLKFLASHPLQVQEDLQNMVEDTFWEIEEVPFE